jgi:hypothetical protein
MRPTCPTLPLPLAVAVLVSCGGSPTEPGPLLLDDLVPADVLAASWIADVDLARGEVTVVPAGPAAEASRVLADYFGVPAAERSLVGGDVIEVLPVPGSLEFAPANMASGRRRVAFEIQVRNTLSRTVLEGPEDFPAPPPGVAGPVLFALRTVVTATDGATGGSGNDLVVETPNEGTVHASDSIWSGPPHDFFNEGACGERAGDAGGGRDCFLYLPLVEEGTGASRIGGSASSAPVRVGWDVELTVNRFRSDLVVGADLADAGPTP